MGQTIATMICPISGERGIRTPGPVTVNSFQDCRNRPLCQLSVAKIHFEPYLPNKLLALVNKDLYIYQLHPLYTNYSTNKNENIPFTLSNSHI